MPNPVLPKRSAWHWPTWQQLVAWAVALAVGVPAALPMIPDVIATRYPWLRPGLALVSGAILFVTRSPNSPPPAQVGALLDEVVRLSAHQKPQTLRGDIPVVPRRHSSTAVTVATPVPDGEDEADTNPGGIPPR